MQKDSFLENIYELETLWIESKARLKNAKKLKILDQILKIAKETRSKLIKKHELR